MVVLGLVMMMVGTVLTFALIFDAATIVGLFVVSSWSTAGPLLIASGLVFVLIGTIGRAWLHRRARQEAGSLR